MSAQMESLLLVIPQGMSHTELFSFSFRLTHLVRRSPLLVTEQLHRKIFEMGQRIRQLEDALAILQSNVSTEPHPLLADQKLTINHKPSPSESGSFEDGLSEMLDGLGTLTIGNSGEAKYFGASGGSEVRGRIRGHLMIYQIDLMALNYRLCYW